jgi:hypothetical protein
LEGLDLFAQSEDFLSDEYRGRYREITADFDVSKGAIINVMNLVRASSGLVIP